MIVIMAAPAAPAAAPVLAHNAYRALLPANAPLGTHAPVGLVNAALRAQGANQAEIAEWHNIEQHYNSTVARRNYAGNLTNAVGCHLATFLTRQEAGKDYRRLPLGQRHAHINAHVAAYMIEHLKVKPPAGWQVCLTCAITGSVSTRHT